MEGKELLTEEFLHTQAIKGLAKEFRSWAASFTEVAECLEAGILPDKFKATLESRKLRDLYCRCNKLREVFLRLTRRAQIQAIDAMAKPSSSNPKLTRSPGRPKKISHELSQK